MLIPGKLDTVGSKHIPQSEEAFSRSLASNLLSETLTQKKIMVSKN